jgi:hypothetical protein
VPYSVVREEIDCSHGRCGDGSDAIDRRATQGRAAINAMSCENVRSFIVLSFGSSCR